MEDESPPIALPLFPSPNAIITTFKSSKRGYLYYLQQREFAKGDNI
jgi:hypothetical protein